MGIYLLPDNGKSNETQTYNFQRSAYNAVHPWETRTDPFHMKQQCVCYKQIESLSCWTM